MSGPSGIPQPAPILCDLPFHSQLLFIRLRSIGDIVLMTPALALLKRWRADLKISVLVESCFFALLEANSDVDQLICLDGKQPGNSDWRVRLGRVREIRSQRFAVAVNLHGGPTSAWITAASGAQWRVGFAHYPRKIIYNLQVPDARLILAQEIVHTTEHQASALFWLGLPREEIPAPQLVVPSRWEDSARTRLEGLAINSGTPFAVVHPTALFPTKQWPPERFAELGKYLEKEKGLTTVYTCGPGESSVLDAVEQATGKSIRRLEDLHLAELMAILEQASLFVGNDSGPAHIAGALGVPSVVIFGSSNSRIWKPWKAQAQIVQNPYSCNPCPGDRCYQFHRPECILSVGVEQVRSAVVTALNPPSPVSPPARSS